MTGSATRLILLASLMVNLVLIGVLGGMMLHRTGSADTWQDRAARHHATPDEDRAMRTTFRAAWTQAEELRRANDLAREALHETLTAPEFDPAAARQQFRQQQETEAAMQAAMQESLVDQMEELSREQRIQLAERLARRGRRSRRSGHRDRERRRTNPE